MSARELIVDTLAYMPPSRILGDLTADDASRRLAPGMHSIAEIVAHAAFWQDWFLARCAGTATPMVERAGAGWPAVSVADWPALVDRFRTGLSAVAVMGDDPATVDSPLTPPIEWPPLSAYTRRDVLAHIAVHNAHHLGQIVTLRQIMGRWPPPEGSWTW